MTHIRYGILVGAVGFALACGKSEQPGDTGQNPPPPPPPPPQTDGGTTPGESCAPAPTTVAFLREGRSGNIAGKSELVVIPDTNNLATSSVVTQGSDFCDSKICLLTPDLSRLIYVRFDGANDKLYSAPVANFRVDTSPAAQTVLSEKLVAAASVALDRAGRRVYFFEPNAQNDLIYMDLKSIPVAGGQKTTVRPSLGLSAVFAISQDGASVAIGDVHPAGRCTTLYYQSADGRNGIPLRIIRSKLDGNPKAQTERLALTPQNDAVYALVNIDNVNFMYLIKTNGDDKAGGQTDCEDVTTVPNAIPNREIGRVPCAVKVDPANICRIHSDLFVSQDGNTVYFLGGNDFPTQHQQFAEVFSMPRGLTGVTRLTESTGPFGTNNRAIEWPMDDLDMSPDRCNILYSSDIPWTVRFLGREIAPRTTDDREVWTRPLKGDERTPFMMTQDISWRAIAPRYIVRQ